MANAALAEAVGAFTASCPTFRTNSDFEFVDAFVKLTSVLHCCLALSDQSSSRLIAQLESDEPQRLMTRSITNAAMGRLAQSSAFFDPISGIVERARVCSECQLKTVDSDPMVGLDFCVLFNNDIPNIRKTFKNWRFEEGMRTRTIKSQKWKLLPMLGERKEVIVSTVYDYLCDFNSTPGEDTK